MKPIEDRIAQLELENQRLAVELGSLTESHDRLAQVHFNMANKMAETERALAKFLQLRDSHLETLHDRLESLRVVVEGITNNTAVSIKLPSEEVN